ncbi:WD40/YVTN/BNR-like repeat-containing protein [Runella sp.]|uniref:WD40/YVTN/BNR-like repeat-containing protein n=1 Tax=Runella sp. TaxID=1960881 RepID=UPI003D0C5352
MKNFTLFFFLLLVCSLLKAISQTPTITTNTTIICNGQSVTLTGSNIPANSTLQWTLNGSPISGATQSVYQTSVLGNYQLTATTVSNNPNPWATRSMPVAHTGNSLGISPQYWEMHFPDSQIGYAVGSSYQKGGVVAKTTDGGDTWVSALIDGGTSTFVDVYFINSQTGWIVNRDGKIKKTTDGGTTWATYTAPDSPDLTGIHFVNAQTGWAVAWGGKIVKTSDGGVNWTTQNSGTTKNLFACFFVNEQTGWVVGENNTILKTTNGGTSWVLQASGTSATPWYTDVYFVNDQTGWAVNHEGRCSGTTDGGNTWITTLVGEGFEHVDVKFFNTSTGWITCNDFNNGGVNTTFKTTDGGVNWTPYSLGISGFQNLMSSSFTDENHGCAYSSAGDGRFLKYSAVLTSQQLSNTITLNAATAIYTLKSGNWTDPTVWSCGAIPDETQNVTIKSGHTILLANTMGVQKCKGLLVEQGAVFENTTNYFLAKP